MTVNILPLLCNTFMEAHHRNWGEKEIPLSLARLQSISGESRGTKLVCAHCAFSVLVMRDFNGDFWWYCVTSTGQLPFTVKNRPKTM